MPVPTHWTTFTGFPSPPEAPLGLSFNDHGSTGPGVRGVNGIGRRPWGRVPPSPTASVELGQHRLPLSLQRSPPGGRDDERSTSPWLAGMRSTLRVSMTRARSPEPAQRTGFGFPQVSISGRLIRCSESSEAAPGGSGRAGTPPAACGGAHGSAMASNGISGIVPSLSLQGNGSSFASQHFRRGLRPA